MKRTLVATALAASLLFVGFASAETNTALFPSTNASAQVSFYRADPASGGVALATATVNNSPVAATISGTEGANYVTVSFEGEDHTFELAASGNNKNDVMLELTGANTGDALLVSDTGTVSLAELIDALADDPDLLEGLAQANAVG